ncbi:hypothetical protein IKJ53_00615, partial [bacterium]|nr:hypothetical protein [bacterium]
MTDSGSSYSYNEALLGGAIYNEGRIVGEKKNKDGTYSDVAGLVSSKFVSNSAENGGAIYNTNNGYTWGNKVSFITNSATIAGGAVYNNIDVSLDSNEIVLYSNSKITLDSSTFKQNDAILGGAVYNEYEMTLNKSTFTQNSTKGTVAEVPVLDDEGQVVLTRVPLEAKGGAIYNNGTKFEYKNAQEEDVSEVVGSTLNLNNTSFYGNYAQQVLENSKEIYGYGGAIYNGEYGNLNVVKGTFGKKNTKTTMNANKADFGGAIYNAGTLTTDSPKFTFNTANQGGALYNDGVMTVGRSTFTSNSAYEIVKTIDADGNPETTNDITVETTCGYGGAIYNSSEKDGNKVLGSTFSKNTATEGGAIYNEGKLDIDRYDLVTISKGKEKHKYYNNSFSSNSANKGGAIYNASATGMSINYATFTSNKATDIKLDDGTVVSKGQGGALYIADGSKDNVITNSTFTKNTATQGGAIYAGANSTLTIIDTNFTNNTATEAGGAIYMAEGSEVSIYADAKDVTFSGNKVGTGKYKQSTNSNSIYMELKSVLNLVANEGRKITIKDKIEVVRDANNTENNPKINIGGAGTVYIYNETALSDLVGTLEQGSTMSLRNSRVGTTTFKGLNLDGTSNVELDASLKTGTADKVQAETVEGTGTLNVSSVNVVTNSKTPVEINVGKDSVVSSISTNKAESAEATYKLKSYYDENGLLRVVAYGQRAKSAAIAAPIAAQIGGYLAQINSYDQAFGNLDTEMLLTREERDAREMMNKYASACCHSELVSESQNGINLNSKGLWNRAFATF